MQAYSCFRGRIYYKSDVSVQNSWMYRYLYHFGAEDYEIFKKKSIQLPSFFKKEMFTAMKGVGITDLRLFYVIFTLGIIFKKDVPDSNGYRSMGEIFYKGLDIFKEFGVDRLGTRVIDNQDMVEVEYYINIIRCVSAQKVHKWYIIKDTTASVNQHIGKVLGFKSDALTYVNLANETHMYDTYELYISYLKKYFDKNCPDIVDYITRTLLKKTIMTVHYGIGRDSAFSDFMESVNKLVVTKDIREKLQSNFHKIYKILYKQEVESKYLYLHNRVDFERAVVG